MTRRSCCRVLSLALTGAFIVAAPLGAHQPDPRIRIQVAQADAPPIAPRAVPGVNPARAR